MQTFIIKPSTNKTKKYDVYELPTMKKILSFGAKGYSDFPTHKDDKRKVNYIKRHSVLEDWTNLEKSGTWSRYVLWNQPTIKSSISDMQRKFNIKILI